MALAPVEFIDAGLDWATFTAPVHTTGTELASRADLFIRSESSRGCIIRPWSMRGYEGLQCGSIAAGLRVDSGIVRLGGVLAQQHWRYFFPFAENCSRLDLQATFRFDQEAAELIKSTYRGALNHYRKHTNGPEVLLLKGSRGSATIYFGRRVSHMFGRIYDKGKQSKLDHYINCVRFEVEVKGKAAWANICDIAEKAPADLSSGLGSLEVTDICARVGSYFTDLGVGTWPTSVNPSLLRSACDRSDSQRLLLWLAHQVRPTVKKLISMGFADEVRGALFADGPDVDQTPEPGESVGAMEWDSPGDGAFDDEEGE